MILLLLFLFTSQFLRAHEIEAFYPIRPFVGPCAPVYLKAVINDSEGGIDFGNFEVTYTKEQILNPMWKEKEAILIQETYGSKEAVATAKVKRDKIPPENEIYFRIADPNDPSGKKSLAIFAVAANFSFDDPRHPINTSGPVIPLDYFEGMKTYLDARYKKRIETGMLVVDPSVGPGQRALIANALTSRAFKFLWKAIQFRDQDVIYVVASSGSHLIKSYTSIGFEHRSPAQIRQDDPAVKIPDGEEFYVGTLENLYAKSRKPIATLLHEVYDKQLREGATLQEKVRILNDFIANMTNAGKAANLAPFYARFEAQLLLGDFTAAEQDLAHIKSYEKMDLRKALRSELHYEVFKRYHPVLRSGNPQSALEYLSAGSTKETFRDALKITKIESMTYLSAWIQLESGMDAQATETLRILDQQWKISRGANQGMLVFSQVPLDAYGRANVLSLEEFQTSKNVPFKNIFQITEQNLIDEPNAVSKSYRLYRAKMLRNMGQYDAALREEKIAALL